jgi:hypothetical protein
MVLTKNHKVMLATFIRDNKDIMNAAFSTKITKDVKKKKWAEIFDLLKSHGADIEDVATLKRVSFDNLNL